jgi:transposase
MKLTTRIESGAGQRNRTLSSDFRLYLGRESLLRVILDAVQTVDPDRFGIDNRRPPAFRPQMMLTLLAYCYSASIYGSRDIERAIRHDPTVRYICARTYPDWETIRRFRRRHRPLIQECLAYVMKQTWALKFDEGEADYVGYDWFESEFVGQVNTEALDRLDVAASMDSIESD